MPLLSPSEGLGDKFEKLANTFYRKSKENEIESKWLESLRDTLLPKLISGELPILDAEKVLEDVQ